MWTFEDLNVDLVAESLSYIPAENKFWIVSLDQVPGESSPEDGSDSLKLKGWFGRIIVT